MGRRARDVSGCGGRAELVPSREPEGTVSHTAGEVSGIYLANCHGIHAAKSCYTPVAR